MSNTSNTAFHDIFGFSCDCWSSASVFVASSNLVINLIITSFLVEAAPVATFLEAAVVRERLWLHLWSKYNGEPHRGCRLGNVSRANDWLRGRRDQV